MDELSPLIRGKRRRNRSERMEAIKELMKAKRKKAIEEITKGKEMVNKLKSLPSLYSREDGNDGDGLVSTDLLLTQILTSFTNTLCFLNRTKYSNNNNDGMVFDSDEDSFPATTTAPSRESEDSGDSSECNPLEDRRGCYKRRKTAHSRTVDTPTLVDDGYAWKIYGQKVILDAKHPISRERSHITQRLSHNESLQANADVTAEPGTILGHMMHEDIINQRDGANNIVRQYIAKGENRDKIELLLLITSLVLEAMSAVFEQLQLALLGMVMAILGLILCLIELAYKVRKENATWELRGSLPWFYSRHPHHRLFGSIVEYFGLVAALWQLFHSTIGYLFALQEKSNPIRMTVVMFLFTFCLLLREFMLKYSKRSPRHSTEP